MDPFGISSIVDGAAALGQARMQSEMTVRSLRKALDVQGQVALSLIQAAVSASAGTRAASPPGVGGLVDLVA
ncbi:MAG: YjfB family protein [Gemmatimonadota bacterium]